MQYRRRLRSRIVLSFLLLGTLLSVLFAISTLALQNYLEDQLIGETLAQELDDYVSQLRLDSSVVEPFYTRIQGYITRPGDPNQTVSAEVRNLPSGVHDVKISDGVFKAAIKKEEDLWAFLIYDVSDNQRIKTQLIFWLVGVVMVFSALSFMLGAWSSSHVMKPVTDLAARLDNLNEESGSFHWPLLTHSLFLSLMTAAGLAFVALLLAYAGRRHGDRTTRFLTRISVMGYALPGTVLAVGLTIVIAFLDNRIIGILEIITGGRSVQLISDVGAAVVPEGVVEPHIRVLGANLDLVRTQRLVDENGRVDPELVAEAVVQ